MKLFLLALIGVITNAAPKTDDPDYSPCNETALNITWGVDYIGGSSKFDYYECANSANSLRTTMKSLTLYNDNGKKQSQNKVTSFASQNWYWNTSEYANLTDANNNTVDAVCNTYVAVLSVGTGVSFEFTSCVLFGEYEYEVCTEEETEGEETDTVCKNVTSSKSSLKWSFKLGQYPFDSVNDTLQFVVEVQQNGAGSSFTENTTDANVYTAKIGNFDFVAPKSAQVTNGGNTSDVSCGVDCVNQGSNQIECTFTFNYYTGSLEYDPTIGSDGEEENSSNNILSFINVYLMILVAMLTVFSF